MGQLSAKLEYALATYLAGVVNFSAIYQGEASTTKVTPELICSASQGSEEPPFTGNFWMEFSVLARSSFAEDVDGIDPKIAHDALAESVYNAIAVSNLPELQTTAGNIGTGFTCMGMEAFQLKSDPRDDVWESTISGKLYCCPSALPA